MSALLAAAAITGGAVNLAKGLFGAVQSARARKGINRLLANPVEYKRPGEYAQELAKRAQMAGQSQMPGQGIITDNIGQATSQAFSAAAKGSISSNTYGKSVGDIYSKQLQAYQDLGVQSAQWQQTQKENYLNTLQRGAEYSDTEWAENKLRPWETQMNQYQSQKQSGGQNLWGGIEGMAGGLMSFAGTKYAGDIMKGLQGTGGGSSKVTYNPNQQFSTPIGGQSYNPQKNLNDTLLKMLQGININKPS